MVRGFQRSKRGLHVGSRSRRQINLKYVNEKRLVDIGLDLLLHLVREQKRDIATVPLATVARQYFDYIAVMAALDVEIADEYLVIAATLVYLKSKSLLPPIPTEFLAEGEETPEEVEERLRRLI